MTITEKKQSHRYKEQASGYHGDRAGGGATDGQGSKRCKLLVIKKTYGEHNIHHKAYSQYCYNNNNGLVTDGYLVTRRINS